MYDVKSKAHVQVGGVGWGELKSLELEPGVRKRWGKDVKNLSLLLISNIKIELETAGG